jgi:choline dehydrogenase-like flavoprotein
MQDTADVLVIGSGAAGGALTWKLTELGVKVVCLEQGGWIEPTSFPSAKPDYETQLIRGDFNFDPNVDKTGRLLCSRRKYPPAIEMFNAVGVHNTLEGHFPIPSFRFRDASLDIADSPVLLET